MTFSEIKRLFTMISSDICTNKRTTDAIYSCVDRLTSAILLKSRTDFSVVLTGHPNCPFQNSLSSQLLDTAKPNTTTQLKVAEQSKVQPRNVPW